MNFLREAELKEPVERVTGFRIRRATYRPAPPSNPTGSQGGGFAEPWEFNFKMRVAAEGAKETNPVSQTIVVILEMQRVL
jgi:hypothetical protein